jgi:hypothetical protein
LDPLKKLHSQVLREENRHLTSLMAAFKLLERHEPALAALVLRVMGSHESAARWMAEAVTGPDKQTPYAVLAEGRARDLATLLLESIG